MRTESWPELRNALGAAQDRRAALQLFGAATGYQPLVPQKRLHLFSYPDRIDKFFCAGIGTGKSHAGIVEDILCAMMNPGGCGLIVAPTYDQALHVLLPRFLHWCELLDKAGYPLLKKFRWSQMRAELVCGGEVYFRSVAKVDNLLGFEFSWIHFDESETVANPERIWEALSGRCRQQAHFRQMLGTSTPRGLRGVIGLFHRARESYSTPEERDQVRRRYAFVRATTLDNPHLPEDYLAGLKSTLSKRAWQQEVMAEILRPATAVFDEFSRARHQLICKRHEWTGASYDLAYDAGDQWPHVLWVANANGRSVIFDELCEDGWTLDRLHQEIVARCQRLGRMPEMIVCDRAVKREIQWAFETFPMSRVERMHTRHEQSVTEGVELVRNRLDPIEGDPQIRVASYLFDSPPRRGIVPCLTNYRYPQRIDGTLAPSPMKDNVHDHGIDALRMQQTKRYGEEYRLSRMVARYTGG